VAMCSDNGLPDNALRVVVAQYIQAPIWSCMGHGMELPARDGADDRTREACCASAIHLVIPAFSEWMAAHARPGDGALRAWRASVPMDDTGHVRRPRYWSRRRAARFTTISRSQAGRLRRVRAVRTCVGDKGTDGHVADGEMVLPWGRTRSPLC